VEVDEQRRERYTVLRPQHLRDVNEAAVLRRLIAHGAQPRRDLARAVGLTRAPMTRIVARLAERGIVRETEQSASDRPARGRPAIPVELVRDAAIVIGVHIGVRTLTLGVAGLDGRVDAVRLDEYDRTWPDARARIVRYVRESVAGAGARQVLGVGVIVGGHVDPERGVLHAHPVLDWRDVAVRDELAEQTGVAVHVESNARAHATGDIVFGTVDGAQDFVHLFVGNVVEAAVVIGGRVRAGFGGAGGELSTWTVPDEDGRAVGVEAALGDYAVVERARRLGVPGDGDVDLAAMTALIDGPSGDVVRRVLVERAERVGVLLAQLDALLAPELFVLSSGVIAVSGTLEAAGRSLAAATRPGQRVPELRAAAHGTNPVVSSAAAVVLDRTLLAAARPDYSSASAGALPADS
jgi:predicted NBD/HSP70 family sugar kinase